MVTTVQVEVVDAGEVLERACPICRGDLREARLRRYLPVTHSRLLPIATIEKLYQCDDCKENQKQSFAYLVEGKEDERELHLRTALELATKTGIACMTYAASIDGDYSLIEAKLLADATLNTKVDINAREVVDRVRSEDGEEYVFGLIRLAAQHLPVTQLVSVISQTARMIMIDGEISVEEKALLQKLIKEAGLPRDIYANIIKQAKVEMLTKVSVG